MGATTHRPETWREGSHDEDERQVLEALADDRWDFRTVSGIARQIDVSEERVAEILEHSTFVRQSHAPGPDGGKLYTLAERPVSTREDLAATQAIIAKDVP